MILPRFYSADYHCNRDFQRCSEIFQRSFSAIIDFTEILQCWFSLFQRFSEICRDFPEISFSDYNRWFRLKQRFYRHPMVLNYTWKNRFWEQNLNIDATKKWKLMSVWLPSSVLLLLFDCRTRSCNDTKTEKVFCSSTWSNFWKIPEKSYKTTISTLYFDIFQVKWVFRTKFSKIRINRQQRL